MTKRITYGYGKLQKRLQPRRDEIDRLKEKAKTDSTLAEKIAYKEKACVLCSGLICFLIGLFIRSILRSMNTPCDASAAAPLIRL